MTSSSTAWPEEPAPDAVKRWLSSFFRTADTKGRPAAEKFATFFTEDAAMHGTAGVLNGRAAILESRSKAWDNVDKRKHEVLRVYTAAKNFSDIVVIGRLDSMLKNGREVGFEFVARVVFDRETNDDPKASLYQVWADSAPMARAMAG